MPHGRLIAKEFITHWETQESIVGVGHLPPSKARFYNRSTEYSYDVIVPDNISFLDLSSFIGKKTKVTIEILPE